MVREADRSRQSAAVSTRDDDVVAADDRGRENGLRVRGDVELVVLERRGSQIAGQRRRQRNGTGGEDRRRREEKRPEHGEGTPKPGRAVIPHAPHGLRIGSCKVPM